MRTRRIALLVAVLAGCAPQTTGAPPVASPSPAASVGPSAAAPSGTPSVPDLVWQRAGKMTGSVYDENGQLLTEGVTVTATSLNPSYPYAMTVEAQGGHYEVTGVPSSVQIKVTATKVGWTPRSRLVTGPALDTPVVDFGAPTDPQAAPFYLSNYPEVMAVEPAVDTPVANVTQIKVMLSEPLDAVNRARFAEALRLVPANDFAAPDMSRPRDVSQQDGVDLPFTAWPYAIAEDATFDNEFETRATVVWDAEGRVATFHLPAPLITSNRGVATYNVVLAAKATEKIVDTEGLPLGTNAEGRRGTSPAADGVLIENAFLKPSLSLSAADLGASAEKRWALLHVPAARFSLLEDDERPRLQAVSAGVSDGDTRITLRFSKPLAAFDGTREGRRDAGLTALPRYTFMVSDSANELEAVPLKGEASVSLSADTVDFDRSAEFELSPAAGNAIEVELDPAQPAVLRLVVRDNTRLFASTVRAIKARAEGVQDPTGNMLNEAEVDANTVMGGVTAR